MADKTKTRSASRTGTATLEFDEFELNSTMQEFLKEEEKDTGKSIWNIATISGMVMIFLAFTFLIQSVGLPVGDFLSGLSEGLVGSSALPLIGGGLITLVGFGFLVGDRKRARKIKKARKKAAKSQSASYTDIPGSEDNRYSSGSKLNNALDSKDQRSSSQSSALDFDEYGYRHSKRLMKSRSDKKWAGVCGGLAKYFGISATVVRFIFVAAFFMGWGASLLVYFGLSLAMPKEPVEMMDDFNF
ncbi:MAG: PspC domain-containing protein [Gracilimonas sp.]|uniref:PspC domain-containing protein n=1 Tax=Gracilimonas sp. TaxID=1974203 RepID=UPI0037504B51|nr:PspC domain-containing protein [Gracilimonas sp.]